MSTEVITKMRARVAQCRRLAQWIHDPKSRNALLEMADEIDADVRKLVEEEAQKP